ACSSGVSSSAEVKARRKGRRACRNQPPESSEAAPASGAIDASSASEGGGAPVVDGGTAPLGAGDAGSSFRSIKEARAPPDPGMSGQRSAGRYWIRRSLHRGRPEATTRAGETPRPIGGVLLGGRKRRAGGWRSPIGRHLREHDRGQVDPELARGGGLALLLGLCPRRPEGRHGDGPGGRGGGGPNPP